MHNKVEIIAEIGVNHNGKMDLAFELIDVAASSGADIVKLQTSIPSLVTSRYAPKAEYQLASTDSRESLLEMCSRLNLSFEDTRRLKEYAERRRIKFLSTPFDSVSIEFLDTLGLTCLKIPSGEITNLPYLRKIGSLGKALIMSTGMAEMEEIEAAIGILTSAGTPKEKMTVLHCNTAYPTPMEDVNLKAMLTMRDQLGVRVGYSDHTLGIAVPIAAAAMGAAVIEKHFSLSREMEGPDHGASLEPDELTAMVKAIRDVEVAMGDGRKTPSASERKNILVVRKSIVAGRLIKKGELFTEDNIATKRPGSGVSPMEWDNYLGRSADREYQPDQPIQRYDPD